MKKVLILSYDFPPLGSGSVLRAPRFAKYFPAHDWEAHIVTSTPKTYYARDDGLLNSIDTSKTRVYRTQSRGKKNMLNSDRLAFLPNEGRRRFMFRLSHFFHFFRIPDLKKGWIKKAVKRASEVIELEAIDVIFATAPPFSALVAGKELREKFNIPLVVDYRDSWIHSPSVFFPTKVHRFLNSKLEMEVLRAADEVITVNRRIKEYIIENYPGIRHQDINIIPHGFDPADFRRETPPENSGARRMRLTHAGYFFDLFSPRSFLEALSAVFSRRPELRTKIEACFLGLLSRENLALIKQYNVSGSVFAPGYVSHDECIRYMMSSDVLWFTVNKGRGDELATPVRLSEYIGARKPILACVPDGAAKQMLRFHEAVRICEPDKPEEIADLIIELYELYEKGALPVPNPENVSKYNAERLTGELVRYFQFMIDIGTQAKIKENTI